jgi:hypothetical protein
LEGYRRKARTISRREEYDAGFRNPTGRER